jgi:membrane-bound lytic murein transglycosylase D
MIPITVKSGDSLSTIARRYDSDVSTIRRINRLHGSTIRAGDTLLIPGSSATPDGLPLAARNRTATYEVKPGDSIWAIAKTFDVSADALMKTNQVTSKDVLQIGQRLHIPGTARDLVRTINYQVQRGDSLSRIAERFDVSVADIARWNELDTSAYLRPGQQMRLHVAHGTNMGD